jgi:transposase-like protein
MAFLSIQCPHCHSDQIVKRGKTGCGTQRYLCQNATCATGSFLLDYRYQGRLPEVKHQIIDMSLNASGVRDTARVLRISTNTVLSELNRIRTSQPLTLTVTQVRQDEPVKSVGDGKSSPDAVRQGSQLLLRAERAGSGNGRVYHLTFMATDPAGAQCHGTVTVCVPHSRQAACGDNGPQYDAWQIGN